MTTDNLAAPDPDVEARAPMASPGRTCPIAYRYRPSDLSIPTMRAETLYAVGGLYGNVGALEEVLRMADDDPSGDVTVVFNGDFNWLNVDPRDFAAVNEGVLRHHATVGNAEAELCETSSRAGCGCGYPDYVENAVVERSNAIMERLRATARRFPDLLRLLRTLPRYLTVEMGGERVAVLHGDPESLAGWGLALEMMEPLDVTMRDHLGCDATTVTTTHQVDAWFREAEVRVFASTHTGLPYAQDVLSAGRVCAIVNNGSAGLPNFHGTRCGVITRISLDPRPPAGALYGLTVPPLRCDALPVRFDPDRWERRFVDQWPPGSPAHDSYMDRITRGTCVRIEQAARGGAVRGSATV